MLVVAAPPIDHDLVDHQARVAAPGRKSILQYLAEAKGRIVAAQADASAAIDSLPAHNAAGR